MEDKKQKLAILSDSGPALILAGPGSGKTTVLTHHIKHLIDNGVSPDKILVITFTRKAAYEMKSRFENLSPTAAYQTVFGTFHSIFFKILKSFDKKERQLVSSEEREEFLLTYTGDVAYAEYYGNRISFYKSLHDKKECRFVNDTERDEFMNVFSEYNKWLKSVKKIDYDDIIEECHRLLCSDKKAVQYLNEKFSHILVDEFQDINSIQYETLKMIAGKKGIIFAVGDEDQSIYGFRGATPDIMKRFVNDYSNVTVINLNRNYRSFQDISDFSQKIIVSNPGRLRTAIPVCYKSDNGSHVHLRVLGERKEEIDAFCRDIVRYSADGKSMACLLRTNKEVAEFKRLLITDVNDENTLKASVIDDLIVFADYILTRNMGSLKRMISLCIPGIPSAMLKDCESLPALKRKLAGSAKGDAVSVFETKLNVLKGLNPYSFLLYLKNVVCLFAIHEARGGFVSAEKIAEIYDEIIEVSKGYKGIKEFKEELSRIRPSDKSITSKKNANLLVTTFHQSKGLEFDYVFIPDVVEGKVPANMSVAECRVEEERRLFYVALTRAREELFVYTIKNEESGGTLPSRFLEKPVY